MSDFLWQTYHRLINEVDTSLTRYVYSELEHTSRLTGLIGPRGVGKTTLILQYIKNHLYDQDNAFYFSADSMVLNEISLVGLVDQLYREKGIIHFFIDEVHQYQNWTQELKNIYDAFPGVTVLFSGSSSIDLVQGSYDLTRRAKLIKLPGLSFREFLNFTTGSQYEVIGYEDLLVNHLKYAAELANVTTVLKHFEDYKQFGYYPFGLHERDRLYEAIANIIEKTIYEDIAKYYQLKTSNLNHFKRIINFLATIPPGDVNMNNLARHLKIDNKTVEHYVDILNRTEMIKLLMPYAKGTQLLEKPSKIYLENTTLHSAVNAFLSSDIQIGTQRELAFLQFIRGAHLPIFSHNKADFQIEDRVFEVGGKNKTFAQTSQLKNQSFLVKDNMLVGSKGEIPLYLFGFLY